MAEGEDVDVLGHQRVDERVAGEHVLDDAVVERIAVGQPGVDRGELALHAAQRRFDGGAGRCAPGRV